MKNKYKDPQKYFITDDIFIATALITKGIEYVMVDVADTRTIYVLKNSTQITGYVNSFYYNDLKVSAKEYSNNFTKLNNIKLATEF